MVYYNIVDKRQTTMNSTTTTNINFATATPEQLKAAGFKFKTVRGQLGKRNTLKSTRFSGKTSNLR